MGKLDEIAPSAPNGATMSLARFTLSASLILGAAGLGGCKSPAPPARSAVTPQTSVGTVAPVIGEDTDREIVDEASGEGVAVLDTTADDTDGGWMSWDEGYAAAQASRTPIMLYVYGDWCARCRELEPVLERDDVLAVTDGLIRIRQNTDENAPWLAEVVGDRNSYVPRVLFLHPDGSRTDLVSPHPRYPYFYTPSMADALKNNAEAAHTM
jgi:hypothetical protein